MKKTGHEKGIRLRIRKWKCETFRLLPEVHFDYLNYSKNHFCFPSWSFMIFIHFRHTEIMIDLFKNKHGQNWYDITESENK